MNAFAFSIVQYPSIINNGEVIISETGVVSVSIPFETTFWAKSVWVTIPTNSPPL